MEKNGFVLRIKLGGVDRVPEALENDHLIIGWAEAEGLLAPELEWERFRGIIREAYYADAENLLGANPIRRQEPRCPDRCCDSQRIRCTRTALVFPVPRTGFPCSPQKIPCSTKQIPCSVA